MTWIIIIITIIFTSFLVSLLLFSYEKNGTECNTNYNTITTANNKSRNTARLHQRTNLFSTPSRQLNRAYETATVGLIHSRWCVMDQADPWSLFSLKAFQSPFREATRYHLHSCQIVVTYIGTLHFQATVLDTLKHHLRPRTAAEVFSMKPSNLLELTS